MIHIWLSCLCAALFLPRDSLGCGSPRSQKGPLCQPSQVSATRSLQTLSLESHSFCSGEQKTAPVHIARPFSQVLPLEPSRQQWKAAYYAAAIRLGTDGSGKNNKRKRKFRLIDMRHGVKSGDAK